MRVPGVIFKMQIRSILILSVLSLLISCTKEEDPIFNYAYYEDFIKYISSSEKYQIVQLKDFIKTNSPEKVVIALRYDIDENIGAAEKLASIEHKYGIRSTYFVLHTADYYGKLYGSKFTRNESIIDHLKNLQDAYGHEVGFHNDLVTLQFIYKIPPKKFLRSELAYLRGNNIDIVGTTYHGSKFCYVYHYFNAYFWKEYPDNGWNYEYLKSGQTTVKIEKDSLQNYNFEYEGGFLHEDYFFTDCDFVDGQRWNMGMVNLDTIQPGKKVIILLHPANWD